MLLIGVMGFLLVRFIIFVVVSYRNDSRLVSNENFK